MRTGSSKDINAVRDDRGAVLPLLAILCLPLLAILGLAIDTGMVLSARNNLSLVTQNAALAALSEYMGKILLKPGDVGCTLGSCVNDKAVDAAIARAQNIAKMNVSSPLSGYASSPIKSSLVTNRLSDPSDPIDSFTKNQSGTQTMDPSSEGFLEIGKYFFENVDYEWDGVSTSIVTGKPSYCVVNGTVWRCRPCGDTAPDSKSCFVPTASTSTKNTAVRFTAQVTPNNRLRTFFIRLLGIKYATFKVSSVATLIPRNDVFLVDLSRSMYLDTHYSKGYYVPPAPLAPPSDPYPVGAVPVPGSRSEFVYAAENTNDPTLYTNIHNYRFINAFCPIINLAGKPHYDCKIDSILSNPQKTADDTKTPENDIETTGDAASWNDMIATYPGNVPNYMHYQYEYKFVIVPFVNQALGVTLPTEFFIHWGRRASSVGPYAEPLFSVLAAVHTGMRILEDRRLGSDSLAFYGFDSQGTFPSGDGLEVSAAPRRMDPVPPTINNSTFKEFYDATDLFGQPGKFVTKGLFPIPRMFSDIQAALVLGLDKISNSSTYQNGKNSIFMFTDGLANCPHDVVINSNSVTFPMSYYKNPPVVYDDYPCSHDGHRIYESISSIISPEFTDQFAKRKIAVSIALVGQGIGAHYLARASGRHFGCINQSEAAQVNTDDYFVLSGTDDGSIDANCGTAYINGTGPCQSGYGWSQYMGMTPQQRRIALKSPNYRAPNELYKIVRDTQGLWIPILPVASNGGAVINFEDELHDACEALKGPNNSGGGKLVQGLTVNGVQVVDMQGRVIYDPKGRTPGVQMQDAMNQVLSSPFMLVDIVE
ncbi:MAG: hypothetical protein J5J00_03335 [Deltaproteobacteria bacterium]|nr:hypothetical protein [Deltaproteobacteria bacterium]